MVFSVPLSFVVCVPDRDFAVGAALTSHLAPVGAQVAPDRVSGGQDRAGAAARQL